MDHRNESDVERFARGELSGEAAGEAVLHLLRRCRACTDRLRPLVAPEPQAPGSTGSEYDDAISRAFARALSRKPEVRVGDWRLVEKGVELLRSRPRGIYGITDEEAEELRGWPWVEVLLRLSFEERYRDPRKMLELAMLARVAAGTLDPDEYEPEVIADHQARAWAELGNAYRVNDELSKAEEMMGIAEERWRQGTGNLFLFARVADLRASLMSSQRLFSEACELLDGVHRLYLKIGDDHLAGRALVSQGNYEAYQGEPRQALRLLRRGLSMLDRERDPQLVTSTTESILGVMVQCGEYREAARVLLESGLRQALADQPLNLIKLRGVEGQILAGLGKLGRAEAAFEEARAGYLAHNLSYKAAIAGLDLAEIWLERGKAAQVEELAKDMLATFRRLGIQREALRAVDYLDKACQKRQATPGLVRRIGQFLRRLEREPQLRFEAV
jgi:tetratricopeptide (TPR) repeat protein